MAWKRKCSLISKMGHGDLIPFVHLVKGIPYGTLSKSNYFIYHVTLCRTIVDE